MDVHDSSKTQSFMQCPRGYFFSHVLGYKQDSPNIHLIFGSAWHDGLETLQIEGFNAKGLEKAMIKFIETFDSEMAKYRDPLAEQLLGESSMNESKQKNIATGIEGLKEYFLTFKNEPHEVLHTEVVGTAPISEERVITVKLDTIYRDKETGKIWSKEHKTTGRLTQAWRDQWSGKFQINAYSYFLQVLFGEDTGGVLVNGAVFRTKDREFVRIPIPANVKNHIQWVYQANHWLDLIEWNFKQLAETKESDPSMNCFPPNSEYCSIFGCRYGGLCHEWANPLRYLDRIPSGYKIEFWDPNRELSAKAKHKVSDNEIKKIIKEAND